MRRPALAVLALALLLALAFLLHRAPRERKPDRPLPPPPPRPVAEPVPALAPEAPAAPEPERRPATAAPAPPTPVAPLVPPGILRGVVRLGGPIPPPRFIRTSADPNCEAMHGARIRSDQFVVDSYGNVQWAFVYIKSGLTGAVPPAPKEPALLDQVACAFTPHVQGVRVGQPVTILNSDALLHNCHAFGVRNREFNFGLPTRGRSETKTFDQEEVMIPLKCDVHPWMKAWIGVLDHPYFGITNAVGQYSIRDLPPGNYVIEVWHEKCKRVASAVAVGPGSESVLDFVLDEQKD